MASVEQRALALGRAQRGLATRTQLVEDASISIATIARRVAAGQWSEPVPNVIDLGTHAASWRRELQQLLLATGPDSWVSHQSAARLHRFLDVARPATPHILIPRGGHAQVGGVRLHTACAIAHDETTVVDRLGCTTKARTMYDLAGGTSIHRLEQLLADLARRDPRALRQLGELLDRYRYKPGRRRLITAVRRLPADAARLGSPLEVLGVIELRRWGAPPPVLQYQVRDRAGAVVKRVDAAWPDAWTIVEFDGAAYHDTTAARAHDQEVRARMHSLGWTVEVVRRPDLDGPRLPAIVERVRHALAV